MYFISFPLNNVVVAEWLRRPTRNLLGSSLAGSVQYILYFVESLKYVLTIQLSNGFF